MRLTFLAILLSAFTLTAADDWRSWLNRGIEAYKSARYQEAVEDFQKSIDLSPNEVAPHLYLATAWMSQYIPGAESPENLGYARNAETQFNTVLQLDYQNFTALRSLAALCYQEAQGMPNEDEKFRKLDEAVSWYQRVLLVDPRDKEAYYSLGVIDWMKWYTKEMRARAQLGMRPDQPGPLTDATVRQDLLARFSSVIADGIANLEKALEIDPQYDDAMAYLSLLIRERGDLRDTAEECQRDVQMADQWVKQALATKKSKGSVGGGGGGGGARYLDAAAGAQQTPQRIRVAADVQKANLSRKVTPVYPQEAKYARIQGTVRFAAVIGKDGHVLNLQLISGHPLLVESTLAAVRHWEYKPTLLDGQPVEIITTIDVNFTLSQ